MLCPFGASDDQLTLVLAVHHAVDDCRPDFCLQQHQHHLMGCAGERVEAVVVPAVVPVPAGTAEPGGGGRGINGVSRFPAFQPGPDSGPERDKRRGVFVRVRHVTVVGTAPRAAPARPRTVAPRCASSTSASRSCNLLLSCLVPRGLALGPRGMPIVRLASSSAWASPGRSERCPGLGGSPAALPGHPVTPSPPADRFGDRAANRKLQFLHRKPVDQRVERWRSSWPTTSDSAYDSAIALVDGGIQSE